MGYQPSQQTQDPNASAIFSGALYGLTAAQASTQVGAGWLQAPASVANKLLPGSDRPVHTTVPGQKQLATKSIGDLVRALGGLQPKDLEDLQRRMYQGGYYGTAKAADIHFGQLDAPTIQAYEDVLMNTARANIAGQQLSWEDVLNQGSMSPAQKQADQNSTPQPVIETSNPEDLIAVVQKAAQDAIGKKLSDGEARQFAQSFIDQQSQYQMQKFNASSTNTSASITSPEDPTDAAMNFVQNTHPNDQNAYGMLGKFNVLLNMISGGGNTG